MIESLEKTTLWTFTFIGASQAAVLDAETKYGFSKVNTVSYKSSTKGTKATWNAVSDSLGMRASKLRSASVGASLFSNDLISNVTLGASSIDENYQSIASIDQIKTVTDKTKKVKSIKKVKGSK